MATTADLITACKIGLQLDTQSTDFDDLLTQKILAVNTYLTNAGISATQLDTDLGIGVIVLGVNDLWNIQGGNADFSNLFHMLSSQLKFVTYTEVV